MCSSGKVDGAKDFLKTLAAVCSLVLCSAKVVLERCKLSLKNYLGKRYSRSVRSSNAYPLHPLSSTFITTVNQAVNKLPKPFLSSQMKKRIPFT